MKQGFFLLIVFIIGCSKSTKVKDRIRGRWYFDHEDVFIKITRNQYIIKNDSPYPEDYKFIGDSIIVKGFKASLFPENYRDTLRVIKLTADTLILRDSDSFLVFHRK